MPKVKKNCANCKYGIDGKNELTALSRFCSKRSRLEKCQIMLVSDGYKCRNWVPGKEYNRQVDEQEADKCQSVED